MQIRKRVLLSLFVLISLLCLGVYTFSTSATTSDENEIRKVVVESVKVTHESFKLPDKYLTDQYLEADKDTISKAKENVKEQLSEVFWTDSEPYQRYWERLQYEPQKEAPTNSMCRTLEGGVKKVRNMDIKVNGNTANVESDMTVYAKFKGPDGKIYNPENGCHFSMVLTKKDGIWKISSEKWDFLPGEAP